MVSTPDRWALASDVTPPRGTLYKTPTRSLDRFEHHQHQFAGHTLQMERIDITGKGQRSKIEKSYVATRRLVVAASNRRGIQLRREHRLCGFRSGLTVPQVSASAKGACSSPEYWALAGGASSAPLTASSPDHAHPKSAHSVSLTA